MRAEDGGDDGGTYGPADRADVGVHSGGGGRVRAGDGAHHMSGQRGERDAEAKPADGSPEQDLPAVVMGEGEDEEQPDRGTAPRTISTLVGSLRASGAVVRPVRSMPSVSGRVRKPEVVIEAPNP